MHTNKLEQTKRGPGESACVVEPLGRDGRQDKRPAVPGLEPDPHAYEEQSRSLNYGYVTIGRGRETGPDGLR